LIKRYFNIGKTLIGWIACLLFIAIPNLQAQPRPTPEYQVKAAFLYNFTRFIDWQPSSFTSDSSPLVIGILGDDPFGEYLADLVRGEHLNRHPIIVRKYRRAEDIAGCHILYISPPATAKSRQILAGLQHQNILTVSDGKNFTRMGGIISFYNENSKVRFSINIASARTAGLEISSKLLKVATISGNNEAYEIE